MKILNLLLTIVFLVLSFFQINGPDPIIWILIYGTMAIVCVMAAFEVYVKRFMLLQVIVYVLYAITLFPSFNAWARSANPSLSFDNLDKMQNPYVEKSREFLGLVICLVVLGLYGFRSTRRKKTHGVPSK
jgi:hypothetical protein